MEKFQGHTNNGLSGKHDLKTVNILAILSFITCSDSAQMLSKDKPQSALLVYQNMKEIDTQEGCL